MREDANGSRCRLLKRIGFAFGRSLELRQIFNSYGLSWNATQFGRRDSIYLTPTFSPRKTPLGSWLTHCDCLFAEEQARSVRPQGSLLNPDRISWFHS
jgi:hypothetical protein